jgi:hypothetical protein
VDPGSSAQSLNPQGALQRFASDHGGNFPHLRSAQDLANDEIQRAIPEFEELAPDDVSVVMFGSWARRELTDGSDNDWAILTPDGRVTDDDVQYLARHCQSRFNEDGKAPGAQDLFGVPFSWNPLVQYIGLDDDTNTNLTRRMLMLLESVPLTGSVRDECCASILERYLEHGVKDHWPPRFLLNDTIRYWRTICVDFEGKHATSGGDDPKWVMRNAKLRTSRTMLFAGGLLPVLFCRLREKHEIPGFLAGQFAAVPVDRVAWAFLEVGLIDEGLRCLNAYDEWISMLQDDDVREALDALRESTRDDSPVFERVRSVGARLQRGLLALLFESSLAPESRRFLVF